MKAGKHSDIPLSYFQIVGEWPDLIVVTKLQNVFRVCMVFGGRCQEVRNICNGFWSKVHSSTTVQRKSIRLDQMIHLNLIFHMVVSNYRLVKSWNSPHFLAQARNGPLRKAIYFDLAFVAAIYRAAMLYRCYEGMDDFFLHSPRRTSAQAESRVS